MRNRSSAASCLVKVNAEGNQGWKGGAQLRREYTNSRSRKTPKRKFWRGFSVIKKDEDFDYRSLF